MGDLNTMDIEIYNGYHGINIYIYGIYNKIPWINFILGYIFFLSSHIFTIGI